jgi:peptidoglycan/LPS O-acetylase OafA/YrhL
MPGPVGGCILAVTVDRNGNNFDVLRLAAALMVIFFTCYGVLGAGMLEPLTRLTSGVFTTGSLGVTIFFIISGYLITMSWDKRRSILKFVWARFLRLVPALIGVALFSVFIVGPLATKIGLMDYFKSPATWEYFRIISVVFPAYHLPGVFQGNPISNVNGALWTLPLESIMYVFILAAGVLGILYKKRFMTLIIMALVGVYLFINVHTVHAMLPIIPCSTLNMIKYYILPVHPFYFLVGSLYYLYQDKIRYGPRLMAAAFVVWVLSFLTPDLLPLTSIICIPYIVLGIAFSPLPHVGHIGKNADISYGLYIYHYPVQQTLVTFFGFEPLTLLVATLCITVPLAWLSWYLIESRALGLKNFDFKRLRIGAAG